MTSRVQGTGMVAAVDEYLADRKQQFTKMSKVVQTEDLLKSGRTSHSSLAANHSAHIPSRSHCRKGVARFTTISSLFSFHSFPSTTSLNLAFSIALQLRAGLPVSAEWGWDLFLWASTVLDSRTIWIEGRKRSFLPMLDMVCCTTPTGIQCQLLLGQ